MSTLIYIYIYIYQNPVTPVVLMSMRILDFGTYMGVLKLLMRIP